MRTKEELLTEIDDLMKKNFDRVGYDYLFSLKNQLMDSVTAQTDVSEHTAPEYKYGKEESREGYIINRLGHISANPSEPERRETLMNVYVYPHEERNTLKEEQYPNYNREAAETFLEKLTSASKAERSYYLKKHAYTGRDVYVLSGDRGIGKTFFINHL